MFGYYVVSGCCFGVKVLVEREEQAEGGRLTVHPFPIHHPTTPHALPLARICKGKISAG